MTTHTLSQALPGTTGVEPHAILVYDGECRLCRRSVAVVGLLDWARMIRPLPWARAIRIYPEVAVVPLDEGVRVRLQDSTVRVGIDGVREVLMRLPLLCPLGMLLYLPPVRRVGARVYRWVADRRCSGGSCGHR